MAGEVNEFEQSAMRDPGALALREAGCQQAMAYERARLFEIVPALDPVHAEPPPANAPPPWVVTCSLGSSAAVDCGVMARTFGQAHVPAPSEIGLVVQTPESSAPLCSGVYDPSTGRLVRPFAAGERYDLSGTDEP
jgi:hypothetical protein